MNRIFQRLRHSLSLSFSTLALSGLALVLAGPPMALAAGQTELATQAGVTGAAARISGEINGSQLVALPNSKHPRAQAQFDAGRVAAGTKLQGMSIVFSRTQKQDADLQALMAAQQNPSSPLYHHWLSPEQFGSRFGLADADIAKVEGWLEQQGFAVDSVARGKTMIRFSGTVGQAEAAFATEIHTYNLKTAAGTESHFAPSTALSVPAALVGVVQGVSNLDNFRPKSHIVVKAKTRPTPHFSGSDGSIYFAPGDIATQYDIQKAYNAGFTGTGQSIAVVGQSEISVSDVENFQNAAGLPVKDPDLVLVPNTGSAAVSAGDETESDLDLEWSGAIAKGATISLVYTGSSSNLGAFDAIEYAIDQRIANIISSSYGTCETDLTSSVQSMLETAFTQAATQGQTVMSAAGDDGSTDCYGTTGLTTAQQEALAVDYPGSSVNVTSVGGTEISQASSTYETQGSAYWEAGGSTTDVISSLLQPVPEQAWNEDEAFCLPYVSEGSSPLCAGGGGTSALFSKPSWQTGVTGLSSSITMRETPDISLNAAIYNPGYLFCSSDQSDWASGQVASCNSGFRDASTGDLTAAGGTSFAAPIFAGMVAIINQQQSYATGQGLINPTLYTLASNSATYASAFHDITTGNNNCDSGSTYCDGSIGFSAGTGYDEATGLGTIDLNNLATAWPANTGASAALIDTTTSIVASNTAPTINTADNFTITVTSDTGSTVPSGTVSITVDGGTAVSEPLTANGTYVFSTTFTTAGSHVVFVAYSGDATHAPSTDSVTVTVGSTSSGTGKFALASTAVTVAQGSSASSTITVTPSGGYTGTVYLTFDTSNDTALQNLCYSFTDTLSNGDGSVSVTGTSPVTTQFTLDANAADCATTAAVLKTGKHSLKSLHATKTASSTSDPSGMKTAPAAVAFAGLLLAGFLGRYSRKFRSFAGVIALVAIGLAVSACGGGGNSTTIPDPGKGTYTITVTGQDSTTANITATTAFTLTIQ